ncbi:MAG: transglutaminase domain-containing protein [Clostridia bacterium]|nr:transglutaminase domain-containing protein [Clostridia bacterium]
MGNNINTKISYKFIALMLSFALILPCLVSCADKDKDILATSIIKTTQEGAEKSESTSDEVNSISDSKGTSASNQGGTTSASSSGTTANKNSVTTKKSSTAKTTTTKAPTATAAPAANAPYASPVIYSTVASGTIAYANDKATIDASNTGDGYIMIKYTGSAAKVKVRVIKDTTYYYDLSLSGNYEVFPLSMGSGTYSVDVLENVSGNSYVQAQSASIGVSLSSSFAPFLRPNQYVNYNGSTTAVLKAAELCTGYSTDLQKLDRIYNFVIDNFTYDSNKAATVSSGYLPDLNSVYAQRKGICFDYAALMTAMLRSQNIPCKLVVGWASSSYHAWVNVYIRNVGWINGAIYFDGQSWKLMDPTFASSANSSSSIMQYIGNGSNYSAQYYY